MKQFFTIQAKSRLVKFYKLSVIHAKDYYYCCIRFKGYLIKSHMVRDKKDTKKKLFSSFSWDLLYMASIAVHDNSVVVAVVQFSVKERDMMTCAMVELLARLPDDK